MSPTEEAELAIVELIQEMGTTITIRNASGTETELLANLGETREIEQPADGRRLPASGVRTKDFLVVTADLAEEITASHRILLSGSTYKPSAINGEPVSRDSGRHGLITRIHTIKIA